MSSPSTPESIIGLRPFKWDTDTWTTLDSYFSQSKILTDHQLSSFNNFVDFVIPQIIEKNNPIVVTTDYDTTHKMFKKTYTIEFLQTYLSKPLIHENTDVIKPLYPNEARLRGLTYAAPMFIDVKYTYRQIVDPTNPRNDVYKEGTETKIPFLKLPIMLHSKYCHLSDHTEATMTELGECEYDQGGYFIVNGGEKVLLSQERVAENQVFVWTPPKVSTSKYTHEAEIKSSLDQRFYPVKGIKVMLTKDPAHRTHEKITKEGYVSGRTFRVKMPLLKEDIPLFIMFRALGITTEKEIFEMIMPDLDNISSNYTNLMVPSVDEARHENITTQETALAYMAKRLNINFKAEFLKENPECQIKYVKDILTRELFPHLGQMVPNLGQTFRKKAFFLGYMTRRLIDCYFGVHPYDDRDHYGNKRVDLAGPLLTQLFRTHFIKLIKDLRQHVLSAMNDKDDMSNFPLLKMIRGCNIDSKIKYGLATGNWNTQKTGMSSSKKGIAQVLNRLSFAGALSHTRRIQSPLERSGSKIVAPRRLHGTHYGMCCPNETPEGQQTGIIKNLALQTLITIQTSDYPIRLILNKLGVRDLIEMIARDINECTKIFVNGDWFGVIREEETRKLFGRLKILKRQGVIVPYISIAWFIDWREIRIQTDGGRYSRPIYIVEDGMSVGVGGNAGSPLAPLRPPEECRLLIERRYDSDPIFRRKFLNKELKWSQFLREFHEETGPTGPLGQNADDG